MKYNELFPTEFNSNPKLKNRFFNYYKTFFKEVGIKKKMRPLKYLSLFTGIGGFEVAIQSIFPNAECIGYSEIKKSAIEVYNNHFPGHKNLGNVTEITKEQIQELVRREGCDLIVGGFPCTNLSSIARTSGNGQGLDGPKSGLFWTMIKIIEWVVEINNNVDVLIENNGSMKNKWKEIITMQLNNIIPKSVIMNKCDGTNVSVQKRNRLYWTSFQIQLDAKIDLKLGDILEDSDILLSQNYIDSCINSIWKSSKNTTCEKIIRGDKYHKFETITVNGGTTRVYNVNKSDNLYSKPITTSDRNNVIAHKQGNEYKIRYYTFNEIKLLFMFPVNYTENKSKSKHMDLFGNSVIVTVLQLVLNNLYQDS